MLHLQPNIHLKTIATKKFNSRGEKVQTIGKLCENVLIKLSDIFDDVDDEPKRVWELASEARKKF